MNNLILTRVILTCHHCGRPLSLTSRRPDAQPSGVYSHAYCYPGAHRDDRTHLDQENQ